MASFAGTSRSSKKTNSNILPSFLLLLMLLLALCIIMRSGADARKRLKKLKFFMRMVVQNNTFLDNPKGQFTAVQSGAPLMPQPYGFGTIHTFNNPITKTATLNDPDGYLGRTKGWYGNCGQDVLTLFLVQTFTYADPKYNGTFSLLGVNIASDLLKSAAIVGGTGNFSFTQGVAVQRLLLTENVNSKIVSWFHYSIRFKH